MPSRSNLVPRELERLSDEVIDRAEFFARNQLREPWDHNQVNADAFNVVSILGWRGSGKSTVLKYSCARLSRLTPPHRYLVLPVIRPELFTDNQSVSASAIAEIQRYLDLADLTTAAAERPGNHRVSIAGETLELRNWASRLLRYASALGQPSSTVETSLDEYISESSRVSGVSSEFHSIWAGFVSELLKAVGASQLLIPIDDADLAPQGFLHVLRSLRWLANVDGVTVLLAADRDEAKASLIHEADEHQDSRRTGDFVHRSSSSAEVSRLRLVDGQLAKVLPSDGRVYVPELEARDRLLFRPLHEKVSLYAMLSRFTVAEPRAPFATLGEVFAVARGRNLETTWMALALPSNPRELTALYRYVQRLAGEDESRASPVALVGYILSLCLEHGLRKSGLAEFETSDFLRQRNYGGGGIEFALDYGGLRSTPRIREQTFYLNLIEDQETVPSLGGSGPRGASRTSSGSLRMELPSLPEWALDVRGEEGAASARWVNESLSMSLALAEDLSSAFPGVFSVLRDGYRSWRGGLNYTEYMGCEGTDGRFLLTPRWEYEYSGWLFYRGWRAVFDSVRQSTLKHDDRSTAVLLDAWRLILHVDRRLPVLAFRPRFVARSTPPTVADIRKGLADLRKRYEEHAGAIKSDDNHYCDWFEQLLPQSLHPWFVPDSTITEIWNGYVDAIDTSTRREIALTGLAGILESRIVRNLGASWIEPVIDLLDVVHPIAAESLRRQHNEKLRLQESAIRIVGDAVNSDLPPSSDRIDEYGGDGDRPPTVEELVDFLGELSRRGDQAR